MVDLRNLGPAAKVLIGVVTGLSALVIVAATLAGGLLLMRGVRRGGGYGYGARACLRSVAPRSRMGGRGMMRDRGGIGRRGYHGGRLFDEDKVENQANYGGVVVHGTVSAVSGADITVKTTDNNTAKVRLADDGTVLRGGAKGAASNVSVGDPIVAVGELTPEGVLSAKLVRIAGGAGCGAFSGVPGWN